MQNPEEEAYSSQAGGKSHRQSSRSVANAQLQVTKLTGNQAHKREGHQEGESAEIGQWEKAV